MNVLGVCAGNGVILHPFRKHLMGNIEIRSVFHTSKNEQWYSNFTCCIDKKLYQRPYTNVDVIIGNPDCGHSSVLSYSRKKSLGNPKQNDSINTYIKAVWNYNPDFFLMENLPKFIETFGKESLEMAFAKYNLVFNIFPVSYLGNSQVSRIRLIIVGVHRRLGKKLASKFKIKENNNHILKSSIELVGDLDYPNKKLCHIRESIKEEITIYAGKKLPLKEIQRIWLEDISDSKRWVVTDRKFSTAPGVYRNLPNELPLTARKANRQFNHEGLMMSPRELARIQGIPDSFKLYYRKAQKKYWINKGRATVAKSPPYEVGVWFYKRLRKLILKNN